MFEQEREKQVAGKAPAGAKDKTAERGGEGEVDEEENRRRREEKGENRYMAPWLGQLGQTVPSSRRREMKDGQVTKAAAMCALPGVDTGCHPSCPRRPPDLTGGLAKLSSPRTRIHGGTA